MAQKMVLHLCIGAIEKGWSSNVIFFTTHVSYLLPSKPYYYHVAGHTILRGYTGFAHPLMFIKTKK